jgi:hypothetical protein
VALGANAICAFGLGSARNDTLDSVAANMWWRLDGSSALKIESDDGVTDNDDVATGETLATLVKRFRFDFTDGLGFHSPPTQGAGGKSNILCSVNKGRDQALARVASGTKFTLNGYSSGLQPMFQISKTSTSVGTLLVRRIRIAYRSQY